LREIQFDSGVFLARKKMLNEGESEEKAINSHEKQQK
jgi:hypothetical protein